MDRREGAQGAYSRSTPNILRLCKASNAGADCRRLRAILVSQNQLPEIFADAYASKEDKQAPVTLWGVQIDPANPRDARVSVVLVKFLRARSVSVPALSLC